MVARPNAALAQIHTQIMWSRLIAVVEERVDAGETQRLRAK